MRRRGGERRQEKPWGGRFSRPMDELLEAFSASVQYDSRLAGHDIAGSIAHARMLGRQGLVAPEDSEAMVRGLEEIRAEIAAGAFAWDPTLEDVHMNIERALAKRIGPAGDRLHTARSRNDQVALDTRMYVRDAVTRIGECLRGLRRVLVRRGLDHLDLVLPGYTHLQRAQPVLLAHHLAAYQEMFSRDNQRLTDLYKRVNVMPLGSAALAGTGLPIDMAFVAGELGFPKVTANSMDAVSDRDFIIEFLAAASMVMMHLSRLAEDVILWASAEFGYADLPDELATGSSIMPQKKNPDVMELVRGKTGRVYGNLMALLTTMKGLPMTYNRDLQEDKEPLFDTVDTLEQALPLVARLMERLRFNGDRMRLAAGDPFLTATDLAEYLVRRGVPFRTAHSQVGRTVGWLAEQGRALADLEPEELAKFCPDAVFEDVKRILTVDASVAARQTLGGTAPQQVAAALGEAEKELAQ